MSTNARQRILVTGATGYIGGRLVPRLLEGGYQVRCFVRDPNRLRGFPWSGSLEISEGNALDESGLVSAMQGISTAYYLIHGMQGGRSDTRNDLQAASNFASASRKANID